MLTAQKKASRSRYWRRLCTCVIIYSAGVVGYAFWSAYADREMSQSRAEVWASHLRSGLTALGFLLLSLPFLSLHRRSQRAHMAELEAANEQLRAAHDSMEVRVRERTADLAAANARLEGEVVQRRRTEEALRESRRSLQAMFDTAPVGLMLLSEDLAIRGFNRRASDITGRFLEEVKGKPVGFGLGCPRAVRHPEMCGKGPACPHCDCCRGLKAVAAGTTDRFKADAGLTLSLHGIEFDRWLGVSAEAIVLDTRRHVLVAFEDISDRKCAERALRESEERLELALDGASLGLWDWYIPTGEVVLNDRWAEMLGYQRVEIDGHIDALLAMGHPDDLPRVKAAIQAHLDGHTDVFDVECRVRSATGEWRWVLDRGRVVERDADGQPLRMAGTQLDVADRKNAEEALREAKKTAEAASQLKSRFLANVSHEIRTPLNAIIGFSEIIRRGNDAENARNQADIILRESEILLNLINDLLDHAKIEAGRMEIESRPLDLDRLVQGISRSYGLQARGKGLELRVDKAADVPRYVLGDELRLRQVLVNLVSNAVKFTDQGSVTVNVSSQPGQGDHVRLRFSVTDTGIGIPREKHRLIFQSFTQADSSTTRRYGGTGLGTTISRQLVELMGGEIGLDSEPGKGSTFWFVVPLQVCAAPPGDHGLESEEHSLGPEGPRLQRAGRILLVEDYATNQEVGRLHLESGGHEVTLAEDGSQAVEWCSRQAFDLILMDVQMPEMDGLEATRRIRSGSSACAGGPIIGMTAHADADSRQECLDAGMNDVLSKPIRRASLLATVDKWIAASAPSPATTETHRSSQAPSGPVAEVPLNYDLATAEFGSREKLEQIISRFLENVEAQIAVLRQAVVAGDAETLRREAHSIKGGAGTLEARPLAAVARQLEDWGRQGQIEQAGALIEELVREFDQLRAYTASSAGSAPATREQDHEIADRR